MKVKLRDQARLSSFSIILFKCTISNFCSHLPARLLKCWLVLFPECVSISACYFLACKNDISSHQSCSLATIPFLGSSSSWKPVLVALRIFSVSNRHRLNLILLAQWGSFQTLQQIKWSLRTASEHGMGWGNRVRITIKGRIKVESGFYLTAVSELLVRHSLCFFLCSMPPPFFPHCPPVSASAQRSEWSQQWAMTVKELIYLWGKKPLWWFPSGCNCAHYCPFTFHHSIITNASLLLIRVCCWTTC